MNYVSGVFKRFAALAMAVMMLAGLCPGILLEVQAAKAANQDACTAEKEVLLMDGEPLRDDQYMGRAGTGVQEGTCGENVTWRFISETGTLEISGSGPMDDYESVDKTPWYPLTHTDLNKPVKKIVVEDGVTKIGAEAFRGGTFNQVFIGDAVTEIGDFAFYSCASLKAVDIPESVERIGVGSFYRCEKLEELTLGNRVKSIGTGAFYWTAVREVILPDSLTSLGEETVEIVNFPYQGGVFSNCVNLETLKISAGLSDIRDLMFHNCRALKEVIIPSGVKSIGKNAFFTCQALQKADLGFVETIGLYGFGQTALQEVTIPGTVISLGEAVFSGCRELSSVTLGDGITSLGLVLFENCTSLKDITIPDSVVSIFSDTQKDGRTMSPFSGCTGLETVRLSKNLEEIPANLFAGCVSLNEIQIPEKVRIVGNRAFSGCTGLKKVDFMGSAPEFSVPEGSLEESRAFHRLVTAG